MQATTTINAVNHHNVTTFRKLRPWQLSVLTALLLSAGYNQAFYNSLAIIGSTQASITLATLLFLLNLFLCQLGGSGKQQKPWLFMLISISAVGQYFMLSYGVLIDKNMLSNALETDLAEVQALLSWKMLPFFLFTDN